MEAALLNKGREYIQEGKFEKTQIIIRRALRENRNEAMALELSGDLFLKQGKLEDAIQRYEQASASYTNSNQYAEAIICLEKIAKVDKTNSEIYTHLADLYRFYGMQNRAVNTMLDLCSWAIDNNKDAIFISGLRKIVELQSKNLALGVSFAKTLLSLGRTQEAGDELNKLKSLAEEAGDEYILDEINKLLLQPDGGEELDPKSRVELGNLLYEIGSKDEAIIEFEKAVSDLIEGGDTNDAINVLNRIVEIDPDNTSAIDKIEELKDGGAKEEAKENIDEAEPTEKAIEIEKEAEETIGEIPLDDVEQIIGEIIPELKDDEVVPEPAPTEKKAEEPEAAETSLTEPDKGLELFQDLSKEIEGFVAATEEESPTAKEKKEPDQKQLDEVSQLEGQIADIEFLLKADEVASTTPSFVVAHEFDDFRSKIIWQEEDTKKKLNLAKMAFVAGTYETALSYITDIRDDKGTWPISLEIEGGSLIKLGRYSEAMRTLATSLLLEEIQETQKIELRYLLATAYEGLGDFDNALREIEHIIHVNPNYKDVKEIYSLMGGEESVYEEPRRVVEESFVISEQAISTPEPAPKPVEQTPVETKEEPTGEEPHEEKLPEEEVLPAIAKEIPRTDKEKTSRELSEETFDNEKIEGENITFL